MNEQSERQGLSSSVVLPDIWSFCGKVSLPLPHHSEITPLCHALLVHFIDDPQILHALCAS